MFTFSKNYILIKTLMLSPEKERSKHQIINERKAKENLTDEYPDVICFCCIKMYYISVV